MSDRALLGVVLVLALVLIVLAGGIAKLSLFDAGEGVPGARHHAQLGPVVFRSNGGMTRNRPAVTCTSSSTCSLVSSIEQTLLEDIRALGSMHPVQRLESPEGKQRLKTDIVEHVRFVVGRNNGDPEEIANVLFHEIITTTVR